MKGHGVEQDLVAAVHYYKLSADQGNEYAQAFYGRCLEEGSGVEQDLVAAAHYYKLSADKGKAPTQLLYAKCLVEGIGVKQDLVAAAQYTKLSADQGYAYSQFYYGQCLRNGRGVEPDLVAAAHYFKLSADQGDANGQFNYARCLEKGNGVEKDLVTAVQYIKQAAGQNLARAQKKLTFMCYFGYGLSASYWEAATWFKRAADRGHGLAKCCYGLCLYMGKGTDLDKEGAHAQFQAAAEGGDHLGEFCLGMLMFEESGCNMNPDSRGWRYLKESAQAGCNEAAVILGLQEFANNKTFQNEYFQRALEQQDLCALYNYGMSLLVSDSTYEEDSIFQKMIDYFLCVAKQGGDGSEYDCKRFFKKRMGYEHSRHRWEIVLLECKCGLPESQFVYGSYLYSQGQFEEALEYFTAAARKNHAEAMFACAVLLHDRSACSRPSPDVRNYFEQAAKGGILEAQYHYGNLLVSSMELKDRKHGAELLSMAAKEILLRRQCKCVNIECGDKTCTFCYNVLPVCLTKRATDNYIWDHFSENIAKIQMPWNEICAQGVTPNMNPNGLTLHHDRWVIWA